jgi:hypothetical protein
MKLRNLLSEKIVLDIEIGDTVLGGRFRNRKIVVDDIGVNELGQPTINGKTILKVRVPKMYPDEMKKNENIENSELAQLIENTVRKILHESIEIKKRDIVYWKIKVGYRYKTLSGKVENIKDEWLTIVLNTVNSHGKRVRKRKNQVTKNKIQ